MTKTTNYEISKKLEEIGFSRQAFWVWISKNCCAPYQTDYDGFLSYDLEILLDALPSEIEYFGNDAYFRMSKDQFWYEEFCNCPFDCPVKRHYNIKIKENESLADTAGRLIILLHENNLIKF
jgi:hypothetical protein